MLCTDYYLHVQMEEEGGVQDLMAFSFFPLTTVLCFGCYRIQEPR